MNIFELNSLPENITRKCGWAIRGLKLLHDSELQSPNCFVLIHIQNAFDVKAAMRHFTESGINRAVITHGTLNDGLDAFPLKDLDSTFSGAVDADQLEAALLGYVQSYENQVSEYNSRSFLNTTSPKLCLIVQQDTSPEISGVCITEDVESSGAILIRAKSSSTTEESAWHTYRVMESDDRFFIENPAGDELLGSAILTTIAKEARRCSAHLGFHLILEWSIADGQLIWHTARPFVPEKWQNPSEFDTKLNQPDDVFTTSLISCQLPGAVTPLTLSAVGEALNSSVRETFSRYKLAKRSKNFPQCNVIASFNNHLFINVSELAKIAEKQPEGFESVIENSLCGQVLKASFSRFWDLTLTDCISHTMRYFNSGNVIKELSPKIKSLGEDFNITLADKSLKEQIEEIDRQLEILNTAFLDFFTIISTASFMSTALYMVFIRSLMVPEKARALMLKCLSDINGISSSDIITSLTTVARESVLDDPKTVNYSCSEIENMLDHSQGESKKALDDFLAHHGHRGFKEMEFRSPSWKNRKKDIAGYVRTILMTNLSEADPDTRTPGYLKKIDELYEPKVASNLKSLIDQARNAVAISDLSQSILVRILGQFKAAYSQLGQQMASQNLIFDADLVFFMTHPELLDFLSQKNMATKEAPAYAYDLAKKAYARKQTYIEQQNLHFDKLHFGKPSPHHEQTSTPESKGLKGKCSTPGVLVGKARVVFNLSDLSQFKPGEIIVTSLADIGLAPYLKMAGALVTETGSGLSTSAIIAREIGTPHITELEDATRLIKTGDTLSLNATAGEITILV